MMFMMLMTFIAGDDAKFFYDKLIQTFFNPAYTDLKIVMRAETHLQVASLVIGMKKFEIVRKGIELSAPFELTWSCYQREDVACGKCDSCALRLRGFQMANLEDPIPYVIRPKY